MSWGLLALVCSCVVMGLAVSTIILAVLKFRPGAAKSVPESMPLPTSLSILAGLSFFSGLGAIVLVTTTAILSLILSMDALIQLSPGDRPAIELARRIILYVSLLPAVGAVALGLAARGVISESRDAVRGRPLYRTGILLAIVTGVVVLDAKIVNPATWTEKGLSFIEKAGGRSAAEHDRGYLGVEHENLGNGKVRIVRVVPGSPAEKAGLKVGDQIIEFNGRPMGGQPLAERIAALKPGTPVTMKAFRGLQLVSVTAELVATFGSLLALLENQSLDAERLAVLNAAGLDRRYSADELTRICAAFDLDANRLKAIQGALPHLLDPQNAYNILAALDLPDSKERVSGWIAEKFKPSK